MSPLPSEPLWAFSRDARFGVCGSARTRSETLALVHDGTSMLCWSKATCREPAHVRALMESDDLRGIIDSNATAGELLERIANSTDKHVADVDRRSTFIKQLKKA